MKAIRNNIKKLFLLLSAGILSAAMLASCMGQKSESPETKGHQWQTSDTLNEWEQDLLRKNGFPTDINELTVNQKISVQHIYEMITYMNEKYGEEFGYAGYIEPGLMQSEELYVYPVKNGSGVESTIYVKIDENGNFYDNYSIGQTEIVNNAEAEMNKFIAEYFKDKNTVSFITEVYPIDHPEKIHGDDYAWELSVDSTFFISENDCTKAELEEFGRVFAQWACNRHLQISARFQLISHRKDLKYITRARHYDYYDMHGDAGPCVYFYHVRIYKDRITDYDADSLLSLEYTHEEFLKNGRTEKWYPTRINNITYNDEVVVDKMEKLWYWKDYYGFNDEVLYDSLQFAEINRLLGIGGWKSEADIQNYTFGWTRNGHKFEFRVVDSERIYADGKPELKLDLYFDGIQLTDFKGIHGDVIGRERDPEYQNGEFRVSLGFDQYALEKYFGIIIKEDTKNETGTVIIKPEAEYSASLLPMLADAILDVFVNQQ